MGRRARRWRRAAIGVLVVAMSVGITGVMSLLFHGELRPDMLATGFVAAVIIDRVVGRITKRYRVALRAANAKLESRVDSHTAQLEEALRTVRAELAQREDLERALAVQERLAVAGELAAGVGHEIGNPLAAVRCNVALARESLADKRDPELDELLADIQAGVEQVAAVAGDLHRLAAPDDATDMVDLAQVIGSAARLCRPQLRSAGVELQVKLADCGPVRGAQTRLVQVVLNLVLNAIRACGPGGCVLLEVHHLGERVEVRVTDDGCGMPQEVLERIWQPGFTTAAAQGGTGLGLAVSRRIVEDLGGKVKARSTPGEGSALSFFLPMMTRRIRLAG